MDANVTWENNRRLLWERVFFAGQSIIYSDYGSAKLASVAESCEAARTALAEWDRTFPPPLLRDDDLSRVSMLSPEQRAELRRMIRSFLDMAVPVDGPHGDDGR